MSTPVSTTSWAEQESVGLPVGRSARRSSGHMAQSARRQRLPRPVMIAPVLGRDATCCCILRAGGRGEWRGGGDEAAAARHEGAHEAVEHLRRRSGKPRNTCWLPPLPSQVLTAGLDPSLAPTCLGGSCGLPLCTRHGCLLARMLLGGPPGRLGVGQPSHSTSWASGGCSYGYTCAPPQARRRSRSSPSSSSR